MGVAEGNVSRRGDHVGDVEGSAFSVEEEEGKGWGTSFWILCAKGRRDVRLVDLLEGCRSHWGTGREGFAGRGRVPLLGMAWAGGRQWLSGRVSDTRRRGERLHQRESMSSLSRRGEERESCASPQVWRVLGAPPMHGKRGSEGYWEEGWNLFSSVRNPTAYRDAPTSG